MSSLLHEAAPAWSSKRAQIMAQYLKIETIGSTGSIILAILKVQVYPFIPHNKTFPLNPAILVFRVPTWTPWAMSKGFGS